MGYKNQDQLIFLLYIFRYSISNYNDLLCIYFELGVSEFWQLFLTHMLSLESVLGFCHGIAKGGDCEVEFYQPSCWLYSVPNFFVF